MSLSEASTLPTGRPRTLAEAQAWMLQKLKAREHPMSLASVEHAEPVIRGLQALDGQHWGDAWGAAGDRVFAQAEAAEARSDAAAAKQRYMEAHGLYFLGRFPCPNHPRKQQNALRERTAYLAAARYFQWPIQRVTLPFRGLSGDGTELVLLVRRPQNVARPPVVLMWGGVDAWKEQMTAMSDALLARGIATVAMDNAGTGESPVKGDATGERQFLPVLDWLAERSDLRGSQVGLLGRSFGGYWVSKLVHLVPQRIAGGVSWGGGAHYMFQRDWIEASRYPDSYLMELVETRCRMLGARNDEEYVAAFARLSLLDQGLLDQPCAPLLLINGKDDRQCPIADVHLLTEHGSPKSVRLFPGGHMGHTPQTLPTIVEWLAQRLASAESRSP